MLNSEPVCSEGPVGEGEQDEVVNKRCWEFQGDITAHEMVTNRSAFTGACVLLGARAVCTSMGH